MRVETRTYRTDDGRLVPAGDPKAATLAYPAGAEVPDAEARRVGLLEAKDDSKGKGKGRSKPDDKAAKQPDDKAKPQGEDKAAKRPEDKSGD